MRLKSSSSFRAASIQAVSRLGPKARSRSTSSRPRTLRGRFRGTRSPTRGHWWALPTPFLLKGTVDVFASGLVIHENVYRRLVRHICERPLQLRLARVVGAPAITKTSDVGHCRKIPDADWKEPKSTSNGSRTDAQYRDLCILLHTIASKK